MHTAIVVACTMTLKPLVSKFFPNLLVPAANSDGSSKDESSGASSGPPLTIGSKPSRMLPPQDGVAVVGVDEVLMGDLEQQRQGVGVEGKEEEEVQVVRNNKPHHGPWVRGDGASERTEDLGREMTARSIG